MEHRQDRSKVYGMRGREEKMIVPITIDDQDIHVLHSKLNRIKGNLSVADVRGKISDLLERYAEYELLEEVFEELG